MLRSLGTGPLCTWPTQRLARLPAHPSTYLHVHTLVCGLVLYNTGVCEKHTPPEKKTFWSIGLQNTKSGAGDQFLLLGRRTKAPWKRSVRFTDTGITGNTTRRSAQVMAFDDRAYAWCWNIGVPYKRAQALSSYALTYSCSSEQPRRTFKFRCKDPRGSAWRGCLCEAPPTRLGAGTLDSSRTISFLVEASA